MNEEGMKNRMKKLMKKKEILLFKHINLLAYEENKTLATNVRMLPVGRKAIQRNAFIIDVRLYREKQKGGKTKRTSWTQNRTKIDGLKDKLDRRTAIFVNFVLYL